MSIYGIWGRGNFAQCLPKELSDEVYSIWKDAQENLEWLTYKILKYPVTLFKNNC